MPSARHWTVSRLILTCLALVASLVPFRLALVAGVYEASIRDQRIVRESGVWSESFATGVSATGVLVVGFVITWTIAAWLGGREERRRFRTIHAAGQRKVLM